MKPEQSQPQQRQHSPASPAADGHSRSTKQPQVIAIVQTKPALLETGANVLSTAVPAAISAVAPATQAIGNAAQAVQQSANQISQTVQQTSLPVKLLCAAIAGISGTSIIYPMDMVKTRLQNQSKAAAAGTAGSAIKYNGAVDCFRKIIKAEGVRGLYRGLPANLVGITPEKAIKLAVNDYAREALAKRHHKTLVDSGKAAPGALINPDNLPIPLGMLAGAVAGFCQVIATNPMEIIKINSQMAGQHALNTPNTKPPTSWQIAKELGIRGVYKGTPATLLRDVPFSFIFFPLQAKLKAYAAERERAKGNTGKVPFKYVFGSGILAGCVAAYAVTPADVIKTRLQTRPSASAASAVQPKVYRGIAHVAKDVYQNEGAKAFFKGGPQRVMIIAPLFGITMLVYEAQQRWFSDMGKNKN